MCYPNLERGLLRFRAHQFCLRRTHYLLLPKLNPAQLQIVVRRLARLGDVKDRAGSISARVAEGMIHVDPAGLCWSRFDPSDAILPVMPDVLSCPKAKASTDELMGKYVRARTSGRAMSVRFSTRLESEPRWRALRASGECALAPDEHEVAVAMLRRAGGNCRLVTDYPESGSVQMRIGNRRYFESVIKSAEAVSNLRVTGTRGPWNSYLLPDGTLGLAARQGLLDELGARLSDALGEWCYFTQ